VGSLFPPPIFSPRGFVRVRGRFHGRKKGVMGAGRLPELILERVRQRYKCLNTHSAFGRAEHNSQTLFDAKPGCGDDDRLPCVRRFGVVLPNLTLARRDHISASVGLRNHLAGGYIVHFAPKSANSVTRCPFRRARSVGFTSWLRGAAGVESQSAHDERPDGR
jgi:hypothetical protein